VCGMYPRRALKPTSVPFMAYVRALRVLDLRVGSMMASDHCRCRCRCRRRCRCRWPWPCSTSCRAGVRRAT
jgi:hypothetical protein